MLVGHRKCCTSPSAKKQRKKILTSWVYTLASACFLLLLLSIVSLKKKGKIHKLE